MIICPICNAPMELTRTRKVAVCTGPEHHRKKVKITPVTVDGKVENRVSFVQRIPGRYSAKVAGWVSSEIYERVTCDPVGMSEAIRRALEVRYKTT